MANFVNEEGKKIGNYVGFITKDKNDVIYMQISTIEVYPKYRKYGYATAILEMVYHHYQKQNNIAYMQPKGVYESASGFWEKQYINKKIPIRRCDTIIEGM